MVQKVLTASGLSAEEMGKAALVQKAMLDGGASPANVAECLKKTLLESGIRWVFVSKLCNNNQKHKNSFIFFI